MIKNIKLEFFKIRHRKVYTSVIGIMAVTFFWALFAQSYKNTESPVQSWMSLFYNISTINCVVMPILTAIAASKLVDLEHKGNTLKLLKTLQGSSNLFNSKFICGIIIMSLAALIQSVSMILIGFLNGYTDIPLNYLLYFNLYTLFVNITLLLLQMILSFQFVNQMIAFVVAVGGSFLGLFSLFFGGIISKFIIWGYYALLSPVRMDWNENTRAVNYYWSQIPFFDLAVIAVVFIVLYICGQKLFKLKEE